MTPAEVGVIAATVTAVIAAFYAVAKVVRSFWSGFRAAVKEATSDIHDDLTRLRGEANGRHAENVDRFQTLDARVATVERDLKQHMKDTGGKA